MTTSSSNKPNEQLTNARNLVKQIQSVLEQISELDLGLNSHQIISESLKSSQSAFQLLEDKLNKPALRIATIGTTSAGKSTLVNALIGHKIAPMDSAELSAGVLHLKHSPRNRLKIKAIKGFCEGFDKYDLSDDEIYNHIREDVFKKFHKEKHDRTINVPEILIEAPLFPTTTKELLGLPEGVDFEIYDLPGLNSINDEENLKVIQNHLQQCFSLVVMDYAHTDRESRATLLKEVKEVKDALGGKTSAIVFALNRIDRRGENDDPLDHRINECAIAIQQELKMPELPDIIPISSLPLFYSQCAWGWGSLAEETKLTTSVDFQKTQIISFQKDCANFIRSFQKENKNVKQWFRDIDDELDENDSLSDELLSPDKLKEWLNWTGKESGGGELWLTLKTRIAERFSEIVIAPTLIDPLKILNVLLSQLGDYAKTQRIENKDAVNAKKAQLQAQFEALNIFLDQESQKFEKEVKSSIEKLQIAMTDAREDEINAAIKALFGIGVNDKEPEAVADLRALVELIKNDLIDQIVEAVRSFYRDELEKDELRELLSKYLPVEQAKSISSASERYRVKGMSGDAIFDGIHKEVCNEDEDKIKLLLDTEKAEHLLYKHMRHGLSSRANYLLQVQQSTLQTALQSLLKKGIADTEMRIQQEMPEACETLMAIYQQQLADVNVASLSEQLFNTQEEIEKKEIIKDERTGIYETKTKKIERSCWENSSYEVTTERIDQNTYTERKFDNLDLMVNKWMSGINQSEKELWNTVGNWFSQSAQKQNELFKESLDKAQSHLQSLLDERLNQSEEEYHTKLSLIDRLDALCRDAKEGKQSLRKVANTRCSSF